MIYIENIFICLALPLIISIFFTSRETKRSRIFIVTGMLACLLSAYVSSFFMEYTSCSATIATIEISPVCEEIMKLLPLLFYYFVFEPKSSSMPEAAIAIAVGFATLENVCCLTENGSEDFTFLLIRGLSAGAIHILCGILSGFGISYIFHHRFLMLTGTVGILGFCTGFHAIYNLLVTSYGIWKIIGYIFPSVMIALLYILGVRLQKLYRIHI